MQEQKSFSGTLTEKKQIKKTIDDGKGNKLVEINIAFPYITEDVKLKKSFDKYYENAANGFARYAETTLAAQARRAAQNEGFVPYSAVMRYISAFEDEKTISAVVDVFVYRGVIEPNTKRFARVWERESAHIMKCGSFIKYPKRKITESITQQATKLLDSGGISFYSDYPAIIRKRFNTDNFYLTPNGCAFFYNGGILNDKTAPCVFVIKNDG